MDGWTSFDGGDMNGRQHVRLLFARNTLRQIVSSIIPSTDALYVILHSSSRINYQHQTKKKCTKMQDVQ